jgi:hypothetical protein
MHHVAIVARYSSNNQFYPSSLSFRARVLVNRTEVSCPIACPSSPEEIVTVITKKFRLNVPAKHIAAPSISSVITVVTVVSVVTSVIPPAIFSSVIVAVLFLRLLIHHISFPSLLVDEL